VRCAPAGSYLDDFLKNIVYFLLWRALIYVFGPQRSRNLSSVLAAKLVGGHGQSFESGSRDHPLLNPSSLFTGEGSKIGSGFQEAGLLIVG